MKRICTLTFLGACLSAAALNAQNNPFSADAKQAYTGIKNTISRAADRMSEADYSFKAAPPSRTYGEIVGHIADIQVMLCGMVKGEKKDIGAGKKTSKADLVAALKESFDYCDGVYDSMTDSAGAEKMKMFGRELTKLGILNFNIGHDQEMYGQMVVYLRIKGLVPPSSDRRP